VFASSTVAATPRPDETSVVFSVKESSSPPAGDVAFVDVVKDELMRVLEV
jgi:hypothetical protein